MRENKVKRTLRDGGVCLGTFVFEFDTTGIARLAAAAGAEFVFFDMEHTGWSVETVRRLLATARPADLAGMVRVPAARYHFVARVLDMGALGVMVPMVESVEQAESIVQSARYPPVGRRGAAFEVAHDDYTGGDVAEKMESANREVLLVAQIETARGVENVEGIAAVEGIDVLWIGHFDLSSSLGIPGQFAHAEFQRAVDRVLAACGRSGKAAGYMASGVEEGRELIRRGFRILAYGGDLWLYREALRQGLEGIRSRSGPSPAG